MKRNRTARVSMRPAALHRHRQPSGKVQGTLHHVAPNSQTEGRPVSGWLLPWRQRPVTRENIPKQRLLTCRWGHVALRMASVRKNTRSLPSSSLRSNDCPRTCSACTRGLTGRESSAQKGRSHSSRSSGDTSSSLRGKVKGQTSTPSPSLSSIKGGD